MSIEEARGKCKKKRDMNGVYFQQIERSNEP